MKAAWIAGLALLGTGTTAATPMPDPHAIRHDIASQGARRTIDGLQRKGQWEAVTDAMDGGRAEWIALAPLLASGSDAGAAEDLGLSLAFALPRNPRAVLTALDMRNGHILGPDRVCGRPFIEDTEPRGYKARSIAALSRVHARGLRARRQACLKALTATR